MSDKIIQTLENAYYRVMDVKWIASISGLGEPEVRIDEVDAAADDIMEAAKLVKETHERHPSNDFRGTPVVRIVPKHGYWHPVEEGLPDDQPVLFCLHCGEVKYGYYDREEKHWITYEACKYKEEWIIRSFIYLQSNVTYWMPMPEPPMIEE